MFKAQLTARTKSLTGGRISFGLLLALLFCMAHPAATVYATKKKPTRGSLKVLTNPGGFPLEIDGKLEGETSTAWHEYSLEAGVHNLVVLLPSGQRWARDVDIVAGRIKCLVLNYRPPVIIPKSPCPYPVNLSAPT